MPRVNFDDLPAHGRLWVFPSSRPLSQEESGALLDEVDTFLDGWAAHGAPLRSGRALVESRFLLVGVDEDAEAPSGCSIDELVNRLQALGGALGTDLVDHAPVFYRDPDGVESAARADFRAMAAAGKVDPETRVFDTTLTRVGELREVGLERPARESWHGRAFFGEGAGA